MSDVFASKFLQGKFIAKISSLTCLLALLFFFSKGRKGRICIWGEEYHIIPVAFVDLLKLHCEKNCRMSNSSVGGKISSFLNDARQKGKNAAKVRDKLRNLFFSVPYQFFSFFTEVHP